MRPEKVQNKNMSLETFDNNEAKSPEVKSSENHINPYMQAGKEPHANVPSLKQRLDRVNDQKKATDIINALRKVGPARVEKIVTNATDYIPVVGSAKMFMEGVKGKQYGTGKELSGWKRVVHGATGAAFLASDLTGIGALASLGGKFIVKGGIKVAGQTAEKLAEQAIVRQAEKVAARKLALKEGATLHERGERRIDKAGQV